MVLEGVQAVAVRLRSSPAVMDAVQAMALSLAKLMATIHTIGCPYVVPGRADGNGME